VQEQADNLSRNHNLNITHFLIRNGGIGGYLRAIIDLFYLPGKIRPTSYMCIMAYRHWS
jgi:hypothetical protein